MQCVCGDIECIDTRFDNPEPIPPSVEEWEEIEKNNQLNKSNAPSIMELKSWKDYEFGYQPS